MPHVLYLDWNASQRSLISLEAPKSAHNRGLVMMGEGVRNIPYYCCGGTWYPKETGAFLLLVNARGRKQNIGVSTEVTVSGKNTKYRVNPRPEFKKLLGLRV